MLQNNEIVKRRYTAASAISPTQFVVYGGLENNKRLNTGYVYDWFQKSLKPILGSPAD